MIPETLTLPFAKAQVQLSSLLKRLSTNHLSQDMATSRPLPERRNPLLEPEHTPLRQSTHLLHPRSIELDFATLR